MKKSDFISKKDYDRLVTENKELKEKIKNLEKYWRPNTNEKR